MTLDRYSSEGSILMSRSFPRLDASYRWLNIFKKQDKGTRGNIDIEPIFDSSDFKFKLLSNPPNRMEEQALLQK